MASTSVEYGGNEKIGDMEKTPASYEAEGAVRRDSAGRRMSAAHGTVDSTHRKLKARHIQLIGIGYGSLRYIIH
jgi:amino acid permease